MLGISLDEQGIIRIEDSWEDSWVDIWEDSWVDIWEDTWEDN